MNGNDNDIIINYDAGKLIGDSDDISESSIDDGDNMGKVVNTRLKLNWAMNIFRRHLLSKWKRRFIKDFLNYLTINFPALKSLQEQLDKTASRTAPVRWNDEMFKWMSEGLESYRSVWRKRLMLLHSHWMKGADAIIRVFRSLWWDWDDGSSPFYWRWHDWYLSAIRDGLAFSFEQTPPKYMKLQKDIHDKKRKELVVGKLSKALERRYLGEGTINSFTAFFDVPKGSNDIRMVYDDTVNGFNDSIEVLDLVCRHLDRTCEPCRLGTTWWTLMWESVFF